MTVREGQRDTGSAFDRAHGRSRCALIAALIVVVPFSWLGLIVVDVHSPHLAGLLLTSTTLGVIDLVLSLLIVSAIATVLRSPTRLRVGLGLGGVLTLSAVGLLSLLFTPSLAGAAAVFRLFGVAATIVNLRALDRDQFIMFVVTPFAIVALFESTLALMQTLILDSGFYVGAESASGANGWTSGLGSFFHPYSLAAYLAVSMAVILSVQRFRSMKPWEWSAVALASAAMATTFGRMAALSVLLIAVVYAFAWFRRRQRGLAYSALIVSIPAIVTGLVLQSRWIVRATQSTSLQSSGRGQLIARALEIIADNPLFGVGPAQYGPTLATMELTKYDVVMVHNVILMVAAEYGVAIGGLAAIWLIALGVRATRIPAYALGLFLAVLPFLLLDNLHYVYPSGIASFGLWVAVLDFHGGYDEDRSLPATKSRRNAQT